MNKIFETPLYPYYQSVDQTASAPAHHSVVVIGAGPVGLGMAIDLAQHGIDVVVLDDNDKVSFGSRAICFAKRTLEIADRLGFGDKLVDKGVQWNLGKVFFDERKVYEFNLLAEDGHARPAFINLQQYYFEQYLVERVQEINSETPKIDIRGKNRVNAIKDHGTYSALTVTTPDGEYTIHADWVIACDGAGSPTRSMMGLDFVGRVFEDNFLIADVTMEADFPTERWFWFDPPFNRGQSALLHKQPDGVWRIDLQLGWDVDTEAEKQPDRVIPRLKAMLGDDVKFELEWVSIYTFQCRRMEKFRHGNVIFAGDSAHQVSPFGARGANSGLQDVDNLSWKLAHVIKGLAPDTLLDSYDDERIHGADENIMNSTRSTDFITPKSDISRVFRNAVLDLSEHHAFARPLVNSGRLSMPCNYVGHSLTGEDALVGGPARSQPGMPCPDAPLDNDYLLSKLGGGFTLMTLNTDAPSPQEIEGIGIAQLDLSVTSDTNKTLGERFLGTAESAVYLLRPDQHIVARWSEYDAARVQMAMTTALGKTQ